MPSTGRCRPSASRSQAVTGSRGSRLCDRGPPSLVQGPCGTQVGSPRTRAILMTSAPLASHLVHCYRLRSYRPPTLIQPCAGRALPRTASCCGVPCVSGKPALLYCSNFCTALLPAPGVLKHVHTVEPSCSPPRTPVVQPLILAATTGNIATRTRNVYCGHCKFSMVGENGFRGLGDVEPRLLGAGPRAEAPLGRARPSSVRVKASPRVWPRTPRAVSR